MKEVFISFSSENIAEARSLCDFLERNNHSCFISSRDIVAGQEYAAQLISELDKAKLVIMLLSKASNESPHVLREIEYAVSHRTPIIVYPLEEVVLSKSLEYFLMTHQWLNPEMNREKKLLTSIDAILSGKDLQDTVDENETYIDGLNEAEYHAKEMLEAKQVAKRYKKLFLPAIIVILLIFIGLFSCFILSDILFEYKDSKEKSYTSGEKSDDDGSILDAFLEGFLGDEDDDCEDEAEAEIEYKLGDRIELGHYNNRAVEWRVIHDNGDGTLVLIASEILTIKPFDTAEGGEYNEYEGVDYWAYENHIIEDPELCILARGNNDWSLSNIRIWLNSDKELVTYEDQAPTRHASCTGNNYYSNEPGFLYYFSEEEKACIVPVINKTKGNVFSETDEEGYLVTEDLVYLLSRDELSYLTDAGISKYSKITEEALNNDTENYARSFLKDYKVDNYYWWLRDPGDEKANEALLVQTEYEGEDKLIAPWSVGASCFGIRPVITVKTSKLDD